MPENKIYITILENPFKPEDRKRLVCEHVPGKPISEYLPVCQFKDPVSTDSLEVVPANDSDLVMAINGKLVEGPWSEIYPEPEDRIAVASRHGYEAIYGFFAWLVTSLVSSAYWASWWVAALVYGASFVTYAAILYGINSLLSPDAPDTGETKGSSPTYGWDGVSNLYNQGNPIPILIGTNRVAGQVINQYTSIDEDDKCYLNALYAIGHGPITSLAVGDMEINGQSAAYFSGVELIPRLGTLTDSPIVGFDEVYSTQSFNRRISYPKDGVTVPVIVDTVGNTVEKIEIDVVAPALYTMNEKGEVHNNKIKFKVEYKKYGDSEWIAADWYKSKFVLGDPSEVKADLLSLVPMTAVLPKKNELIQWIVDKAIFGETTEFSGTANMWEEGKFIWLIGTEKILLTAERVSSPTLDWTAFGTEVRVRVKERGYDGTTPAAHNIGDTVYVLHYYEATEDDEREMSISGHSTEAVRRTIVIDELAPSRYSVRITRLDMESLSPAKKETIYLGALKEVIKQNLIYPGIAKYAVKILATDQLSSSSPTVTCLPVNSTVQVYNPYTGTWDTNDFTNVAWATYGVLNTYGEVNKDLIIYDDFKAWADYCDEVMDVETGEKRFVINKIIDSEGNLWDKAQEIAKFGHGALFRKGTKISVFVDKAETVVDHIFNMGNIVEGSFIQQYLPMEDRANYVEITYTDLDRDYSKQIVAGYNDDYLDETKVSNRTSINFEASLPRNQIVREVNYRLNCNKYVLKGVEFEVSIEAFTCVLGDLFYFQHDIPNYLSGKSGRIVSADNSGGVGHVTLDQEVTLLPGDSYKVMVRLQDDTIDEKTVASVAVSTTTATLTLTAQWSPSIPSQYDPFMFGLAASYVETYRITNIVRNSDQTFRITGLIYDSRVYTDENAITEETYVEPVFNETSNVKAYEYFALAANGQYVSNIMASWNPAYTAAATTWGVWLKDITDDRLFINASDLGTGFTNAGDGEGDFINVSESVAPKLIGYTDANHKSIGNEHLIIGHTYLIVISPRSRGYVTKTTNSIQIKIIGKVSTPNVVSNFIGVWNVITRSVNFSWTASENIDIDHYEIRYGTDWDSGTVAVGHVTGTSTSDYVGEKVSENRVYWIKAIDHSGNYSESAVSYTVLINTADCPLTTPTGLVLATESVIQSDGTDVSMLMATWDANAEVNDNWHHYELELVRVTGSYTSMHTTRELTFSWQLIPNTNYTVRIRSVDVSGNKTAWSVAISQTTAKDSTAPAAPTWPVSNSITSGIKSIALNWDDNTEYDLAGYVVQRSTNGNFAGEEVSLGILKLSYMVDIQLSVSTQYWYRIRAVDTSGNESDWSTTKTETTSYVTTPDIADDNISRSWQVYSDTNVELTPTSTYVQIAVTDSLTPVDKPLFILYSLHFLHDDIASTDRLHVELYIKRGSTIVYGSQVDMTIPGEFLNSGSGLLLYPFAWNCRDIYAGTSATTYSLWARWHFEDGSSANNLWVADHTFTVLELKK